MNIPELHIDKYKYMAAGNHVGVRLNSSLEKHTYGVRVAHIEASDVTRRIHGTLVWLVGVDDIVTKYCTEETRSDRAVWIRPLFDAVNKVLGLKTRRNDERLMRFKDHLIYVPKELYELDVWLNSLGV